VGGAGANARPRLLLALAITLLLPIGVVLAAGAALPGDATLDVLWLSEASGVLALAVALLSEAPLAREYFTTGFVLLWMGALVYTSRAVQIPEAILLGTSVVAIWIATVRPDVGIARFAAFASAAWVALVSAVRMYMAESVVISSATLDVVLMLGACIALVVIARAHIDGEGRERTLRTLAAWTASLLLARHLVVLASGAYAAVTLTAFYAATGVALIILGGRRNSLGMRRAGLALSLYAPLRAIATAADVENTGIRVAVYFVAGAFMLLVAFLYRSRGRDGEPILRDVVTEG